MESIKNKNHLIKFSKPYGFLEYNKLQMNAFCVISDSGTIFEEASILNLPAVTIRQAHERLEGMDEARVIMSGLKKQRVIEAVEVATNHNSCDTSIIKSVKDYEADNVSKKVLRIIISQSIHGVMNTNGVTFIFLIKNIPVHKWSY